MRLFQMEMEMDVMPNSWKRHWRWLMVVRGPSIEGQQLQVRSLKTCHLCGIAL